MTSSAIATHRPAATLARSAVTTRLTRALTACGILASAVYVTNDVVGATRYPAYSMLNQAISELSAVGAPTTPLWNAFGTLYGVLMLAFAIGVLRIPTRGRALRATGWMLLAFALSGVLWAIFPMHQRGATANWQDVGHIVLSAVSVLLIMAYIAVGAFTLGERFRSYSFATMAALLIAGVVTFTFADELGANEPTPWMGLIERIMIYGYLLWVAVFAAALLRAHRTFGDRSGHDDVGGA